MATIFEPSYLKWANLEMSPKSGTHKIGIWQILHLALVYVINFTTQYQLQIVLYVI